MEFFDGEGCQRPETVEHHAVFEGQTLENRADGLPVGTGRSLPRPGTECGDSRRHAARTGERFVVWVDQNPEGRRRVRHLHQFGIGVFPAFARPDFETLLQQPHAGNVFQQARGALDTAFVGDVAGRRAVVDDRLAHLDPHQRPSAGTQVGEPLVPGRNGRNGRRGVVPGHGYDGNPLQPHIGRQPFVKQTDTMSGHHYVAKKRRVDVHLLQQFGFDPSGAGIQQLRRRSDRIFGNHTARKQIAQGIGHEKQLRGSSELRSPFFVQSI